MTIGINASAAVKKNRTGVEEYAYQLIKHLAMITESQKHRFFLYLPSAVLAKEGLPDNVFDFSFPENFIIKKLWWPLPFFWTQIRLSLEMIFFAPDVLFIPVHILPFIHPKKSIVCVHGLEYEYLRGFYSFSHRLFLRWSTKFSAAKSFRIIAVSQNTKNDLAKIYKTDTDKIKVVKHGISFPPLERGIKGDFLRKKEKYILYLGRIETKKNIQGIIEAYEILNNKYSIHHKLVLAGSKGYGHKNLKIPSDVIQTGFVSQEKKEVLMNNAAIFLFPCFYEGFGLPILEAQAAGIPVVTSYNSSMPEVAGEGALFVDPRNPAQIARAVKKIIDDNLLRDKLIQSGFENIKKFSWEKCARETLDFLSSLE